MNRFPHVSRFKNSIGSISQMFHSAIFIPIFVRASTSHYTPSFPKVNPSS